MSNSLVVEERKDFRKSALHKLRREGFIPAVVYGKHEPSKAIAVKETELLKMVRENGRNVVISINVNGKAENVILGEFQVDPLSRKLTHADFVHVNMASNIHAKVPVLLKGEPKGTDEGGILQLVLHELDILAKPKDIPEEIEVDVRNLEIGHSVKIEEIRDKYSNITIHHDDNEVIASVLAPKFQLDAEEQEVVQA